jgi:hypothetical protein
MVLTKDGIVNLLKLALWNKSGLKNYDIYEGVYDIMHNGSENGLTLEDSDFEKLADEILDRFGTDMDDDYVLDVTMEDIEEEFGRKVRIVNV